MGEDRNYKQNEQEEQYKQHEQKIYEYLQARYEIQEETYTLEDVLEKKKKIEEIEGIDISQSYITGQKKIIRELFYDVGVGREKFNLSAEQSVELNKKQALIILRLLEEFDKEKETDKGKLISNEKLIFADKPTIIHKKCMSIIIKEKVETLIHESADIIYPYINGRVIPDEYYGSLSYVSSFKDIMNIVRADLEEYRKSLNCLENEISVVDLCKWESDNIGVWSEKKVKEWMQYNQKEFSDSDVLFHAKYIKNSMIDNFVKFIGYYSLEDQNSEINKSCVNNNIKKLEDIILDWDKISKKSKKSKKRMAVEEMRFCIDILNELELVLSEVKKELAGESCKNYTLFGIFLWIDLIFGLRTLCLTKTLYEKVVGDTLPDFERRLNIVKEFFDEISEIDRKIDIDVPNIRKADEIINIKNSIKHSFKRSEQEEIDLEDWILGKITDIDNSIEGTFKSNKITNLYEYFLQQKLPEDFVKERSKEYCGEQKEEPLVFKEVINDKIISDISMLFREDLKTEILGWMDCLCAAPRVMEYEDIMKTFTDYLCGLSGSEYDYISHDMRSIKAFKCLFQLVFELCSRNENSEYFSEEIIDNLLKNYKRLLNIEMACNFEETEHGLKRRYGRWIE